MAIREQQIKDMKTIKEVIDQLERELKPQYMNDVFTWKQIVDAVIKVTRPNNLQKSITLDEFLKTYPMFKKRKSQ